MPIPMFLYSVTLQAAAFYNATDLNDFKLVDGTSEEDDSGEPTTTFGKLTYLNPQDSRQYLYRLSPKDANDAAIRTNMQIGKLDVSWRTNLGEQGRLQTSPLSRKPPPPRDIEVTVLATPTEVRCGQGFTMSLRVKNWTASAMELSLLEEQVKVMCVGCERHASRVARTQVRRFNRFVAFIHGACFRTTHDMLPPSSLSLPVLFAAYHFHQAEPILLDGISSSHLGALEAGGSMDMSLDLIAVSTGVHFVSGVSLRDRVTGKTHPLLPLPSCFVIAVDQDAQLGTALGEIEEMSATTTSSSTEPAPDSEC